MEVLPYIFLHLLVGFFVISLIIRLDRDTHYVTSDHVDPIWEYVVAVIGYPVIVVAYLVSAIVAWLNRKAQKTRPFIERYIDFLKR